MTIRVNGEPLEIAGPVTISGLLAGLTIDSRLVAVEHNLIVVKRDKYESVVVQRRGRDRDRELRGRRLGARLRQARNVTSRFRESR